MNLNKLIEVPGFRCEPERSEETQGETYRDNGDEKSESDTMGQLFCRKPMERCF